MVGSSVSAKQSRGSRVNPLPAACSHRTLARAARGGGSSTGVIVNTVFLSRLLYPVRVWSCFL